MNIVCIIFFSISSYFKNLWSQQSIKEFEFDRRKHRRKSTMPKPGLFYAVRQFQVGIFNTSVLAFLPRGQCFKRCTAKDNPKVTQQIPA